MKFLKYNSLVDGGVQEDGGLLGVVDADNKGDALLTVELVDNIVTRVEIDVQVLMAVT